MKGTLAGFGLLHLVVLAGACAPVEGSLRKRAAFDLNCPVENLAVVDIDGATKGVVGCGRRAAYVNRCGPKQDPTSADDACPWLINEDCRPPETK